MAESEGFVPTPDIGILEQEKQEVSAFYGLGSIDNWTPNSRGLVNASYELDDRFFLTIHHRRTPDEMEAVANVTHSIDNSIPVARPALGVGGYAIELAAGPALLTERIPGRHYVGVAHTDKHSIPDELHESLAAYFWRFQESLSSVAAALKARLHSETVTNVGRLPEKLPTVTKPLANYMPQDGLPDFKYPDLIHDDMERQNILTVENKVTGLVDLDSIRSGDVLYEYGHFLFNVVLCDPNANLHTVDLYINQLLDADMIDSADVPALYGHIYEFCISDVIEFHNIANNPVSDQHSQTDVGLLVQQYEQALSLAAQFFGREPS